MAADRKNTDLAQISSTELQQMANAGDRKALSLLRERYRNSDDWQSAGDLARLAMDDRIGQMLSDAEGYKLAVKCRLAALKQDLAGDSPSPLELLLIERIAMCWLDVQQFGLMIAQNKKVTFQQGEYISKQLDAAHRRYLSAIKALATVRKLAIPVVQVNIGDKQVNIAGATPGAEEPPEQVCPDEDERQLRTGDSR